MRRRDFLASLGAGLAACGSGSHTGGAEVPGRSPRPTEPWEGLGPADEQRFPVAVQSGDPTAEGAVLWTRYLGEAELEVVVASWAEDGWTEVDRVAVQPGTGGYVHHELVGMAADRSVAFQFLDAEGSLSPVGELRTAQDAAGEGPVVLGAVSCLDQDHLDFPSLSRLIERGPVDLFCHLGDTIYGDGLQTVEAYRELWALNQSTPGLRAVMLATAQAYTWDDHEVSNNWTQDGVDPAVLEAARTAFFEVTPTRRDPDHPERIWRSISLGRTAEVFVLDCRGERAPEAGQYVSEEQLAWLIEGLQASEATWKIVLNSVPVADLPEVLDAGDLLEDRWEGYREQREALLAGTADIPGLLFLSGDLHFGCVTRVAGSGSHVSVFEVLTGPGGSFLNAVMLLVEEDDSFLWRDAVWSATRLELYATGEARISFIGEEDQTWLDMVVDTEGRVLGKLARHSTK